MNQETPGSWKSGEEPDRDRFISQPEPSSGRMVVMCRKQQSLDGAVGICVRAENFLRLKLPGSTGKLWSREKLCCLSSLNPLQAP